MNYHNVKGMVLLLPFCYCCCVYYFLLAYVAVVQIHLISVSSQITLKKESKCLGGQKRAALGHL